MTKMAYESARQAPRSPHRRRRRRRRRNSHYGVLFALIILIIAVIFFGVRAIRSIVGNVVSSNNVLVYQVGNTNAYKNGKAIQVDTAPYRDSQGNGMASISSLCDNLGLELNWDENAKSGTITLKKTVLTIKLSDTNLQVGDATETFASAPVEKNGVVYAPVKDICQALSWQTGEVAAENGDLIIISQAKKALTDKKIGEITDKALEVLGPAEGQVMSGSIVMRTGSDQLLYEGSTKHMVEEGKKLGAGVLDQDGTAYIPLKAAMTALGGKAEDDGKGAWNVTCGESTATVDADDGKTKVDGKRASGNGFSTYTDQDKNRFYVSPQVLAAILGKTYTDLGDGVFSFTGVTLDGFDSQKAYLKNMKDKLGDAVDGDIPEADVYIALTFDDGPTGKKDGYPNGLTNYLLDGLKQRGAVATFLMVGERVSEVSDVLPRMVNEGHELGNHTMNHPMCHLTGLGTDDIRSQIDDATNAIKDIAGQAPQVLRPVGGGVNSDVKAVAAELGYPIINWSVDTEDWKYRDADHVKKVIVEQAQDGDVVLMHDLYETSVRGALAAIDELQSRTDKTYAFVTVSQLAAIHGITLEPGVVYNALSDEVAQQIADGSYEVKMDLQSNGASQASITANGAVSELSKGESVHIDMDSLRLETTLLNGSSSYVEFAGSYYVNPLEDEIVQPDGVPFDVLASSEEDYNQVTTEITGNLFAILLKVMS